MPMTLALIAFIVTSVFLTSILSGIVGMAGGMILMSLLAWQLDIPQAMILHATAQFFANGSRAVIHRKHIFFKTLPHYFLGIVLIFAVFMATFFMTNKILLFFLLGISPFLSLLVPKEKTFDFTRKSHAMLCGMLVTFFQLTCGVGGPLVDIFFQSRKMTRHEVVATKAITQATAHITKFVYFGFVVSSLGEIIDTGLPIWILLAVIPVAAFGTSLGKTVLDKISDKQFYGATQILLMGIGVLYLIKAAHLWLQ